MRILSRTDPPPVSPISKYNPTLFIFLLVVSIIFCLKVHPSTLHLCFVSGGCSTTVTVTVAGWRALDPTCAFIDWHLTLVIAFRKATVWQFGKSNAEYCLNLRRQVIKMLCSPTQTRSPGHGKCGRTVVHLSGDHANNKERSQPLLGRTFLAVGKTVINHYIYTSFLSKRLTCSCKKKMTKITSFISCFRLLQLTSQARGQPQQPRRLFYFCLHKKG